MGNNSERQTECLCLLLAALFALGQSPAAAADSKLNVVIDLKDGSRLVGTPLVSSVKLESTLATADIPLKSLDHAVFNEDGKTSTLSLNNGDKISGVLQFEEITIKGDLGEVSVPKTAMMRITVREIGDGTIPVNFKITKIQPPCSTITPDAAAFKDASTTETYPLGTTVKAGRGGSASIQLAAGTCTLSGDGELTISKPAKIGELPLISLNSGTIAIKGDKLYTISVKSGLSTFSAKGGSFSVKHTSDNTLSKDVASCTAGSLQIEGLHFAATTGPERAVVTLAYSKDGEFCRLQNNEGTVSVDVTNDTGELQRINLEPAGIMKVWARTSGHNTVITYIVTTPDGKVTQAITTSK